MLSVLGATPGGALSS